MKQNYDDIINLSRPKSNRVKMSLKNRAAQFASFKSLSTHSENDNFNKNNKL